MEAEEARTAALKAALVEASAKHAAYTIQAEAERQAKMAAKEAERQAKMAAKAERYKAAKAERYKAAALQRKQEKAAAAPVPMTSEEARQLAQTEGLMLRVAANTAGYVGVSVDKPGQPKPYKAKVSRGGKPVILGSFASAGEAALCIARDARSQAAA